MRRPARAMLATHLPATQLPGGWAGGYPLRRS